MKGCNLQEQTPPRQNWNRAPATPVFNAPASVIAVIGILIAIHAGLWILGENWHVWSLYALALIPARFTDPALPIMPGSQYWSVASYMLLHADWMHLLFNTLWLLVFGTPTARYLGSARFLLLCLVAGIAGGLASLWLHWGDMVFIIGASGAVSGLLGASIPVIYGKRTEGGARPLVPGELLRNKRALMFTVIWLALTLFSGAAGWTGNSFIAEGGIAWEAHVGGFFAGLFCFYALAPRAQYRTPPSHAG